MTSEKIDKKIEENMFSSETGVVISAINLIKEKGNKLYIPLLFDLLNSNPKTEIVKEISLLLATIKDKETKESFIDAITDEKYKSIRKTILTTCWQNGLDFSSYLPIFVDIIVNDNWENAFEAFTIIDNMEHLPEEKIVKQSIIKIEDEMENATEQKAYFLQEILSKFG